MCDRWIPIMKTLDCITDILNDFKKNILLQSIHTLCFLGTFLDNLRKTLGTVIQYYKCLQICVTNLFNFIMLFDDVFMWFDLFLYIWRYWVRDKWTTFWWEGIDSGDRNHGWCGWWGMVVTYEYSDLFHVLFICQFVGLGELVILELKLLLCLRVMSIVNITYTSYTKYNQSNWIIWEIIINMNMDRFQIN